MSNCNPKCNCNKSTLVTTAVNAQDVLIDGLIEFAVNNVTTGTSIQHTPGSNTTTVSNQGLYIVTFNTDLVSQSAGDITVQLLNNGVAVPGAEATITAAAADTYHVAFTTILKVLKSCPCVVDNTATLQVQVSVASTITNANLAIAQLC